MVKTLPYHGDPFTLATISCGINEGFKAGDLVKISSKEMRRYFLWYVKKVIDQGNGTCILDLVY